MNVRTIYIDIDNVVELVETGRLVMHMGDGEYLNIDMSNYENKKIKIE